MADTANFAWTKPTVGGDTGAWGGILNTALDDIDADVQLIKTTADAALPAADGSATGTLSVDHVEALLNEMGIVSGTVTPDLDLGDVIEMNIATNSITMAVPDNMAGNNIASGFMFIITAGAGGSISWGTKYVWPGGTPPTQSNGVDVYAAIAVNGPTGNIHIVRVSEDSS